MQFRMMRTSAQRRPAVQNRFKLTESFVSNPQISTDESVPVRRERKVYENIEPTVEKSENTTSQTNIASKLVMKSTQNNKRSPVMFMNFEIASRSDDSSVDVANNLIDTVDKVVKIGPTWDSKLLSAQELIDDAKKKSLSFKEEDKEEKKEDKEEKKEAESSEEHVKLSVKELEKSEPKEEKVVKVPNDDLPSDVEIYLPSWLKGKSKEDVEAQFDVKDMKSNLKDLDYSAKQEAPVYKVSFPDEMKYPSQEDSAGYEASLPSKDLTW